MAQTANQRWQTLNQQGIDLQQQGKFAEARRYFEEAVKEAENTFGIQDSQYAISLHNLAAVYWSMREYEKAELLLCQILETTKQTFGTEHPLYATHLNDLGVLYWSMSKYGKAEPLLRQASEFFERTIGEYEKVGQSLRQTWEPVLLPEYARSLHNLGLVYRAMGKYGKAEPLLRQTLEIKERVLGKENPEYAMTLHVLGVLYLKMGQYDKAESFLFETLKVQKRILEPDHPEDAKLLVNIAVLNGCRGKPEEALRYWLNAAQIHNQMIARMFSISDEKRIQKYIQTFQRNYFAMLSTFSEHYSQLQAYTTQVLDVVLKRKALNLEIAAIQRDQSLAHRHPQVKYQFEKLRQVRLQLARLYMEKPGKTLPDQYEYQQKRQVLEEQIETLERSLAKQLPQVALQKKLAAVEHQVITSLLPENSTLIEYVLYWPLDYASHTWGAPRYLLFFLSSQIEDEIQVIDMGDTSAIDTLIEQYRQDVIQEGDRNITVGARQKKHLKTSDLSSGKQLYEKLLQPILEHIGESRQLIIAPDGDITLLPFEILPQPNGRYVIEDFEIHYMDSGRDLLRFEYRDEPQSRPLILADPDFDLTGSAEFVESALVAGKRAYQLEKIAETRCQTEEGQTFYFPRLCNTQREGEYIQTFFKGGADLWTQAQVLDEKVKHIQGPQILHIATHGFFLPQQETDNQNLSADMGMIGFDDQEMFRGKHFENPFLRSGLALAGVNTFFQGKAPAEGAEDGLLTALDVTGMDLIGTELVVLSACETGLGEFHVGEGVYGLRRAFTLAGARTLVLSLWAVPDKETQELMVTFYRKILQGTEKASALHEAQLEMLRKRRDTRQSDSPFYWGAFVCVGDPGKLGELSTKPLQLRTEHADDFTLDKLRPKQALPEHHAISEIPLVLSCRSASLSEQETEALHAANRYVSEKNYDESIAILRQLGQDHQDEEIIFQNLGTVYALKGLVGDALTTFDHILERNPSNMYAFSGIGRLLRENTNIIEAVYGTPEPLHDQPMLSEQHTLQSGLMTAIIDQEAVLLCQTNRTSAGNLTHSPIWYWWQLLEMSSYPVLRVYVEFDYQPYYSYCLLLPIDVADPNMKAWIKQLQRQDSLLFHVYTRNQEYGFSRRLNFRPEHCGNLCRLYEQAQKFLTALPVATRNFESAVKEAREIWNKAMREENSDHNQ